MAQRKLSKCPMCRYSLTGLPARHQCPECGFAYDARMSVRAYDLKRNLIAWGSIFAFLFISTGLDAYERGIVAVSVIRYVTLALPLIFGLYLYWKRRRERIITWPDGLQFIKKGVPDRVYTWNEIKSVRHGRAGWVYLSLRDGTEIRLFGPGFFHRGFLGSRMHKEAARFVKETNELREKYAGTVP